jgi:hypothetical protein
MSTAAALSPVAKIRRSLRLFPLLLALAASAAVVDRVAVVVGSHVITESEVLEEARVTQFLNSEPLNLTPEVRRAAADRLVDQQLIRSEMEIGGYEMPDESEAVAMLAKIRSERSRSPSEFRADLEKYGLTEAQLLAHLRWQIAAIGFTEVRFSPLAPQTDSGAEGAADRAAPGVANAATDNAGAVSKATVDELMEDWLQRTRSETRIRFKEDAFQ